MTRISSSHTSDTTSPHRTSIYSGGGVEVKHPTPVITTVEITEDDEDHSYTESEKEQFRRLWESGNLERTMRMWGETAAGMRWMHDRSTEIWSRFEERLNVWNVALSSVISAGSFMGSGTHAIPQSYVMTITGLLGLAHILINSLAKHYNAAHHAAMHQTASRQFGNFHRTIVAKLSLSSTERGDPRAIFSYLTKENERLYTETLNPHNDAVHAFRYTFLSDNVEFAVPDIVNTCFRISVDKKRAGSEDRQTCTTPMESRERERAFSIDIPSSTN